MATHRVTFLVLLLAGNAGHAAQEAKPSALKQVVKAKVQEINDALINGDFGKVADLTHPKVVELAGGKEATVRLMKNSLNDMKSRGFEFRSCKVDEPSDTVKSGSDLFVTVTFMLELKAPGGKVRQKSFVIGTSPDQGKTWRFVNGDLPIQRIKIILPALPDALKLPSKQQPVLEKD